MKKKKIGLVLGGGGARGIAQIGILKVFEEAGIKPDFIIGSSMGAAIGAAYALGVDISDLEKEVLKYQKRSAMAKFIDPVLPKKSLIQGKKIEKFFEEFYQSKNFSDCKIPLFINATDLEKGKEVILRKGPVTRAVMASIAVPGVFPPVKVDDRYLIDGGVINPTPIDIAINKGADTVIVVDFIMRRSQRLSNPKIVSTMMLAYEYLRSESVKRIIRQHRNNLIIVKPKTKGTIDSFSFNNIKDFIKAGEIAAKEKLPEILKNIK